MAYFQIKRGLEANIPDNLQDGCIYFCTDTGNVFIDYEDQDENGQSVITRKHINANDALTLSGNSLSDIMTAVSSKSQVQIITWEDND